MDDILDLAKLESGSMSIAFDLMDIRDLVYRVRVSSSPRPSKRFGTGCQLPETQIRNSRLG